MKVYKADEEEIDQRLKLDRRQDSIAFCRYFKSEKELPEGFYDLQDKIRNGLEETFNSAYDNGGTWDWNLFYFSAELLISERILVEISDEILNDKLVGLIMSYLEKCPAKYCVILAVYRGMHRGSDYLGRFIINFDEIAVETSLCEVWSKQVPFMEVEERNKGNWSR
jgi:hypothetical protein